MGAVTPRGNRLSGLGRLRAENSLSEHTGSEFEAPQLWPRCLSSIRCYSKQQQRPLLWQSPPT